MRGLRGGRGRSLEKPDGTGIPGHHGGLRAFSQRPAEPPSRCANTDPAPGLLTTGGPGIQRSPGDYDELPGLRTTRQCNLYPSAPPTGKDLPGAQRELATQWSGLFPRATFSLPSPPSPLRLDAGLTLGLEAPSPDSHHKGTPRVWGKEKCCKSRGRAVWSSPQENRP